MIKTSDEKTLSRQAQQEMEETYDIVVLNTKECTFIYKPLRHMHMPRQLSGLRTNNAPTFPDYQLSQRTHDCSDHTNEQQSTGSSQKNPEDYVNGYKKRQP